ncbi:MAG: ABC transporter ATP-binding protein [Nocardioides sp.]|uniref:ABC transporter transmembrane domain-containing protein n=1 Tax=Nocardioides sp. TaxID=35761 RepID=UPI002393A068|nr:ABC transporter ATP-binding protein [Nocardioides sp.]MDE0777774.1 ABC transporter ATP-binding protein [Nocardioides sp.]
MQRIPEVGFAGIDHRSAPRFLFALAARQKASIAWAVVTSSIWNTSQVLIPVAIGRAVDRGITAGNNDELVTWSLVILALGLVRATTGTAFYRQSVVIRTVSGCLAVRLVTRHITALGASVVGRQDVGNLTATSTSDVATIGNGIRHLGRVIGSVVAVVVIMVVMFTISAPLGFLVLVIVPAVVGLSGLLLRPLHRHQDEYRYQQGRLAGRAVDIAAGLRVLRGIGGERRFAAAFHVDSAQLRHADVEVARAEANVSAAEVFMPGLIAAVVTYTAARFVLDERVTIGQMVAFYAFAVFLTLPLHDIIEGASQITRALVAAARVTDLLNIEAPHRAQQAQGDASWPLGPLNDSYSGLSVPPSTLLAVVCADPPDADALACRLARFTESGTAKVGDTPLSSLPLPLVRSRVLLARNSDRFFADTVRREIAASTTVTPEEISEALRIACATDIVDALPAGLDTEMTGRGRTFSGGQLQRLRLTRSLVAGAEVTLLVEPTNAVDAYTEHAIAVNLADHHRSPVDGRSTVVFTMSPLVLQQAHRVAYVVDGRVAAHGTHAELLERHPGYRDLMTRDETLAVEP